MVEFIPWRVTVGPGERFSVEFDLPVIHRSINFVRRRSFKVLARTRVVSMNRSVMLRLVAAILCSSAMACAPQKTAQPREHGVTNVNTGANQARRDLIELFSWWTAPGEAEALQALIETHKSAHPEARVFNAVASNGGRSRPILDRRLAEGDPPDLFQLNAHDLRALVASNPGKVAPIDSLVDSLELRKSAFSEVLENVTIGGKVHAMPVNLHRENSMFYNRALFDAHGITPPRTVDELMKACEKLSSAGVTPIATSHQGWILRIMFHSILMGRMGAAHYNDYFLGKLPADDPLLHESIRTLADILRKYTNPDAGEDGFGWTNAAQAVYNGDAAMFFHGDWVKGYLIQLGWKPGRDFGVMGAPGASELFLYGVDTFALPAGAMNEKGARGFLATIASPEGQLHFNQAKGSSPIRHDVDRGALDSLAKETLDDLEHAKFRVMVPSLPDWDDALGAFAKDRDQGRLVQRLTASVPRAKG